jgi:hypothetical protein
VAVAVAEPLAAECIRAKSQELNAPAVASKRSAPFVF